MPTLYWTNVSTDQAWENPINWFSDAGATVPAANVPWLDGTDTTYLAYDLTLATGETSSPIMDVNEVGLNFGTGATGSCDIASITNNGTINDGTFTGDSFTNNGNIYSGTFTGNDFTNDNGNIFDGTFSGSDFENNAYIVGGTFSGDDFDNYNVITAGTFNGDDFSNVGSISNGLFAGDYFFNYATISGGTFTGDDLGNSGSIEGGTYSPTGTATLTEYSGTIFSVSLAVSQDPGFYASGETYSPVITTVIDNLAAGNIKSGVMILGVAGTLAAEAASSIGRPGVNV